MTDELNSWLKPEEALSRFSEPQKTLLNKKDSDFKEKVTRYGFVIENIGFLIAENTLSEVVKNTKIYPIPNTRNWMKGLVNLRGNLVPVYDFSVLLGLVTENNQYNNLLILGKDSLSVGVLIGGLPRPCNIEDWQKLEELPSGVAGLEDYVSEAYLADDIVWMDFDQRRYFESIKQQVVV